MGFQHCRRPRDKIFNVIAFDQNGGNIKIFEVYFVRISCRGFFSSRRKKSWYLFDLND